MTLKKLNSSNGLRLLKVSVLTLLLLAFALPLVPPAQASLESDFLVILNAERASLGKNPLSINSALSTAAYLHSKDMGDNNYFSHTSLDGRTFAQRITAAGYTGYYSAGENIAYHSGSADVAKVYAMWKGSAGHYANMIGDFNEAGLGVYSTRGFTYYTLDLGKRNTPTPPPTPGADYSLSASPLTLNIQAGSSGSSTVTAASLNGFSGIITFTTSAPTGWTVNINPSSVTISSGTTKASTLTITVPSTVAAGTYTIIVTGTSGSTSHSTTVTVNVSVKPEPTPPKDFSISTSTSTLNVKLASTASLSTTVASLGGWSGSVSFRTSAPNGWKVTFNPSWVTVTSGGSVSSTLSITVPSNALAKAYTIWIIGVGNSFSRDLAVTVNVQTSQPAQTVPSAPQNLKASSGDGKVGLSWVAPLDNGGSAITNYKIYKRVATTEILFATVGSVFSYTDSEVTNGQTYYYRVAAENSVGESAKSTEASATPSVPTPGTLNVAVTTDKPSYLRGTSVVATIKVTDNFIGTPLSGCSISVQLYEPSGAKVGSAVLKTGASGTVQAGFGFASTIPKGTYTLSVTASISGYQSKTEQTTFAIT